MTTEGPPKPPESTPPNQEEGEGGELSREQAEKVLDRRARERARMLERLDVPSGAKGLERYLGEPFPPELRKYARIVSVCAFYAVEKSLNSSSSDPIVQVMNHVIHEGHIREIKEIGEIRDEDDPLILRSQTSKLRAMALIYRYFNEEDPATPLKKHFLQRFSDLVSRLGLETPRHMKPFLPPAQEPTIEKESVINAGAQKGIAQATEEARRAHEERGALPVFAERMAIGETAQAIEAIEAADARVEEKIVEEIKKLFRDFKFKDPSKIVDVLLGKAPF